MTDLLPHPPTPDNTYQQEVIAHRRFIETALRLAEQIKAAVAAFQAHLTRADHSSFIDDVADELAAAARDAVATLEGWLAGEPDHV
jgi:hypothetical protein